MTEIIINSEEQFKHIIADNEAVVAYFSTKDCNVCKILKPKIVNLFATDFPKVQFVYVNVNNLKELAAQNSVFSVPTILLYVEGRETLRNSRNINLDEFRDTVNRIYKMLFE
jgi:thioredoxin 1